jgi:excisionase family DNA binding protein
VSLTSEKFLTAKQVCELLGINRKTLHLWCQSRKIPYFQAGRTIRFRESALASFLTRNENIAKPAMVRSAA